MHLNLAISLRSAERCEEAIPHYRRALQLRPGNEGALFDLGVCLETESRADEAIQVYRQYIQAVRGRDASAAARAQERIDALGGR
jgi:Flp pilus assembly protein TadD